MSDSVWPHRRQPTRLPRPWDSPGKNTGVGCHFLLQSMKVKSKSEVAQSCPTLSYPINCSLPGSSVHGIFQTRVLKWVAIAFSNESLGKTNLINNDIKQICSCPCLELGLLLGQVDRGRFQAIVSFLWFPSLYILCIYCRFMLWCYHEAYIKHVIDTVVHFKLLAI